MTSNVHYAEFYITNVCDANCQNCNRFNNYAFTGHFKWDDHKDDYAQWAKKLEVGLMCILGGEPFTNPDLINWVEGIRELWPNTNLQITTNGHFIKKFYKLYNSMSLSAKQNFKLDISAHSDESRVKATEQLIEYFGVPKLGTLKNGNSRMDFDNGLVVWINSSTGFYDSALSLNKVDDSFSLYNNDPVEANAACISAGSHHFINGKLYKCPLVAVLPLFMDQFLVNLSADDKKLVKSYTPAEHTMTDTELEKITTTFKNAEVIPQCKFCSVSKKMSPIVLGPKIKVRKLDK